ncbi:LLM class flavin-dependent oxidoreductase [Rhizobium laguerreae]|uniref:LLM class flavin-dependent oxidoreductase n=1 Tax=Rhizobium laguerreae TaxID=1076926 RepID=UPI001FEF2CF8|nr:LLM class flavin-dependent oxidoreductase [Rhizobium laguerreae]
MRCSFQTIRALGADPAQRPLHSFEPLTLSTALAVAVPDIGFEITVSSTCSAPYDLARRLATLDHISGGRVICNIVSSFNPAVAANYGSAPLPPREARYRQAHEFMSVVGALLDSWELRLPADPQARLWDPDFARPIGHRGEFYNVAGPLNVPRDRRRRALIGQAGASGPGLDFAAAYGEIIYCSLLSLSAARAFRDELHKLAIAKGRDVGSLSVVPGLVPIIGRNREEALERHEAVSGTGSEEGLLRLRQGC